MFWRNVFDRNALQVVFQHHFGLVQQFKPVAHRGKAKMQDFFFVLQKLNFLHEHFAQGRERGIAANLKGGANFTEVKAHLLVILERGNRKQVVVRSCITFVALQVKKRELKKRELLQNKAKYLFLKKIWESAYTRAGSFFVRDYIYKI